jgi:hypothetical protein
MSTQGSVWGGPGYYQSTLLRFYNTTICSGEPWEVYNRCTYYATLELWLANMPETCTVYNVNGSQLAIKANMPETCTVYNVNGSQLAINIIKCPNNCNGLYC